jgi:hypothetical protein
MKSVHIIFYVKMCSFKYGDCCGRDCMVVGFITIYAIYAQLKTVPMKSVHIIFYVKMCSFKYGDCCGRDCMVVGFITIYAISAYHHLSRPWGGALDTTLSDRVGQ